VVINLCRNAAQAMEGRGKLRIEAGLIELAGQTLLSHGRLSAGRHLRLAVRDNGPGLDGYRNAASPYGGALAGKWPIRVNPEDVRHAWFQDPGDGVWHRLDWEHAPLLEVPFSADAAAHARRLASADRLDPATALRNLLQRWDRGTVTDRRDRRLAVRLSAEHAAIPAFEMDTTSGPTADPADGPAPEGGATTVATAAPIGDDDDSDDLDEDEGFYDDAFEMLT
jgi:hypothetical protein